MGPPSNAPTVSRRAVMQGALASVGLLAVMGSSACSSGGTDDDDPLAALGRSLAKGPDGPRLATAPEGLETPIADPAALLLGLAGLDATIRADFAEGRTVLADGWLLADTEAAALVAYARG
jgi:hypothetical protein